MADNSGLDWSKAWEWLKTAGIIAGSVCTPALAIYRAVRKARADRTADGIETRRQDAADKRDAIDAMQRIIDIKDKDEADCRAELEQVRQDERKERHRANAAEQREAVLTDKIGDLERYVRRLEARGRDGVPAVGKGLEPETD